MKTKCTLYHSSAGSLTMSDNNDEFPAYETLGIRITYGGLLIGVAGRAASSAGKPGLAGSELRLLAGFYRPQEGARPMADQDAKAVLQLVHVPDAGPDGTQRPGDFGLVGADAGGRA